MRIYLAGASVEVAMVASGDRYSIFTSHADREFANHDDALAFLLVLGLGRTK